MIDFLMISTRSTKRGQVEIYPKFIIKKSSDLMIRGGDFYAIWLEDKGLWSTEEQDALQLIDNELDKYVEENKTRFDSSIRVLHMWDSDSGMIDNWHKYCQRQMRDSFHMLDEKLIFSNDKTIKRDYASKKLNYPLEECDISNYERLMSTIYDPDEREKIEWAIGSIITGDSKKLQKFMVLYGGAGTGKSTVLNIIQKLFDGYYCVFDAKALGSSSSVFALEAFKMNPLVAIQHDGDLSKIEDNTRLNSLVSHELMTVNEKFKATYTSRFKCFLFMGTNKPVKITDAKSGLIRRLIDVTPSGNKIPQSDYHKIMKGIEFELGGIACHCKDIYLADPEKYEDYVPLNMMGASNDFYNFMLDSYFIFKQNDGTTLKSAWEMYKAYCDEARVPYPVPQRVFKEELKNYFNDYTDKLETEAGEKLKNWYSLFKKEKFVSDIKPKKSKKNESTSWIEFKEQKSIFDEKCANFPAQYANSKEIPSYKWDKVKTVLKDINTSQLHYVKVPENHIVIDFDIQDGEGNKSFEKNLEAASKWPKTYAELSKSGQGIHLHYIYTGDPSTLSRIYEDNIEIKVFNGNSSLRRKLSKCNDLDISSISSGLPLKGESKVVNFEAIKSEKALRTLIKRNLNKEISPNTKPSVDFIYNDLEKAYNSGLKYDVRDLRNPILAFAASSTHQSDYCVKLVDKMKFKSDESSENVENFSADLAIYDVEVFPNLFLVSYKILGPNREVVTFKNPTPQQIEALLRFRLIGYNCRRYDNHIMYARLMGYSNEELYNLSQRIVVAQDPKAFFGEAYNLSYTDIYDYSSVKQSLKKWELDLGITHHELGMKWNEPVPEDQWDLVAKYCENDVIATEAVWYATQGDFDARKILVDLVKSMHDISDVCVNDTTNTLSTKLIFGKNKTPQSAFNYRNLSKPVSYKEYRIYRERFGKDYVFRIFDDSGLPTYQIYDGKLDLPDGYSILPFFPGYEFDRGVSTYLGEEIGEGGRVYSEPGIYRYVWDGDVASMHPHSIIYETLFGPEYTKRFKDIVDARVAIKHKDFNTAGSMLNGVLKPYLKEDTAKSLSQALKLVVNSIYGLTSARFINPFRDPRNVDNIVAKRGALFMTLLKQQVQKLGYSVAHIKTDSIKIPNATEEIKDFVIKFGKEYGYSFETEADFDRLCLVNDAVYVAKDINGVWTATGTQFQIPYVFKKLFTHEPIEFEDMCELKSVKSALYLDLNEDLPEGEHNYRFIGKNGVFCPMQPGCGGGVLLREEKDGRLSAATGTKGYLWMESDIVKNLKLQDKIDENYYINLANNAIETINQFGDFEMFVADDNESEIKSDKLPDDWDKK